ncbi:Cyclic di-GMP phosphodiesterase response regulator RpfG [Anaerolineales bacterium]|nr:Cyclic di-GMP phosphodiesterase response regulator RpfG [Anaerolineales bacterium]
MEQSITYENLTAQTPAKELWTLLKVSSSLASTLDLTEVLQIAIESAADLLGFESGAIYTLENNLLYLGATTPPLTPQFPNELRLAQLCDHPHIERVVSTKKPVYLDDARSALLSPAEKMVVDSRHLVSILYFPLMLKEIVTGVFIVGTTEKVRQFTKSEMDLCHILSFQVSLAVANAQLYKKAQQALAELSQAYDSTLKGWSQVLDMRDHVTDEHTNRVAELTVALAARMDISDDELGHIRRGALLHDIGKMAIPDAILQKPDVLTADEQEIMKTHPEKAYRLLSQIDYLAPAMDIPYCHHEKWDGTGYPRGLKGEEIPLSARLFAVVDVYDALTTDRPYRKAWSREKALAHIQEQSGGHFCPQVVDAFLEIMRE